MLVKTCLPRVRKAGRKLKYFQCSSSALKAQINLAVNMFLQHAAGVEAEGVSIGELLAADVEGVESISAIGAVLQQIFLGLSEFLASLVLAKAVAAAHDSCRLDGEDQVIIVLAVEHRHEPLFTGKALVDEQVFLVVTHWVSKVDILDLPTMPLKLMAHHPMEVLLVDGIVAAESSTVVVIHNYLAFVVHVVAAKVVN